MTASTLASRTPVSRFTKGLTTRPHIKILLAINVANLFCLITFNLLSLPVRFLLFAYPLALLAMIYLLSGVTVRRASIRVDPISLCLAVSFWIILNLPRISYPFEWNTPGVVAALGDDYHRLAELISMTLSGSFPLKHYMNQNYLFSFYYCALIPFAFLKILIPVLTLKDVIFIGNAILSYLVIAGLVEVCTYFFSNTSQLRSCLFLCTFFGGADYCFYPFFGVGHYEWWQKGLFHANTQISSFYTAIFWTIHHFFSFFTLILAYTVSRYFFFRNAGWKTALVIILLAASFYSSPFAFFPAILFLFSWRTIIFNRLRHHPVSAALVLLICLIPLPLFFGKLVGQTFVLSEFSVIQSQNVLTNKLLSLPVYLGFVPLVEFFGIPLLLFFVYRFFDSKEKQHFRIAWIYFLSTYVIAYSGSNNLSMRGMLLPAFVFYALFARHLRHFSSFWKKMFVRPLVYITIFLTSLGTLKEMTFQGQVAISNYSNSFNQRALFSYFHRIARDTNIQYIPFFPNQRPYVAPYFYAEKMMKGTPLRKMRDKDRELIKVGTTDHLFLPF